MKVLFLNTSNKGGAFIAAKRIQKVLESNNVSIDFITQKNFLDSTSKFQKRFLVICLKAISFIQQYFYSKSYISFGFLGHIKSEEINSSDYDLIHLHWVNSNFISLNEIEKITKPIIWTVHDQWLVNGVRHTREEKSKFFNLEKWNQKRIYRVINKKNVHIISPSKWLGNQIIAKHNIEVKVIPNPFEPPIIKNFVKTSNKSERVNIAFLHSNTRDFHKGFDLLLRALNLINDDDKPLLHLVSKDEIDYPYIFRESFIKNENQLGSFLKKMDFVCVPSRIDNFPNLCVESKAFKIPVLAFKIGGIPEIIEHKRNGYLAEPFDIEDLKNGYYFLLKNNKKIEQSIPNKKHVDCIRQDYLNIYNNAIKDI
jgi:glycosyltransferase involved in cell wall biosynthesis